MLLPTLFMLCALGNEATPPLLHFDCPRAAGDIVVDGEAKDAAWKNAVVVTEFRLWNTFEKPNSATTVRLCYDDAFLYLLFECEDDDLFVLYDERDGYLWESDVVELFLQPPILNERKLPVYYEFEIAPNNAVFDAEMVNTGSGGFKRWAGWDCGVKTAVKVRGTINNWKDVDQGYTVEMAIPVAAFKEAIGDRPLKGQTWQFNAVRADFSVRFKKEERSSTANVVDSPHYKEGYFSLTFK